MAILRDAPDREWLELRDQIGVHSSVDVGDALAALVAEGLVERRRDGRVRLPADA